MKSFKAAAKKEVLRGSTVSGGSRAKGPTPALKKGASKKNSADDDFIKIQPHRDVIDAGQIVKELGDHIDTRYIEHDDLDRLDAGLGLNHDEEGQQLIDAARLAAGDRRQIVSAEVKAFLFGGKHPLNTAAGSAAISAVATSTTSPAAATALKDIFTPPRIDDTIAFVGHNRNTVTCATVLDMTVFYGDKTGHVFRAEPNPAFVRGAASTLTSSTAGGSEYFYQRIPMNPKHKGAVLSLAISDTRGNRPANWGKERSSVDMSVLNYLVSGGQDGAIHVWKAVTGDYVGVLKMHRGPVNGLCFRQWSSMLVSASADTTVRLWSVPEMHCEDKYYGHNGPINGISSLRKERCATAGADRAVRHWKLDAATQVEFTTDGASAECVAMLDDIHVVTGTSTGNLVLFDVNRRYPLQTIEQPHGYGFVGDGTGLEMVEGRPSALSEARGNSITAIAALPYGDLVATGSYSGIIALWHFSGAAATNNGSAAKQQRHEGTDTKPTNRLTLLATIPCKGCVNSLQFGPNGNVLIAAVGKDQRGGRWLTINSALNGVMIIPLHKKGEEEVSAVTQTYAISSEELMSAASKGNRSRRIDNPLIQDPSHQPTTAEAKLEARRKKRKELLAKRKAARDDARKKSDEGDAIDNWSETEEEAHTNTRPTKKVVMERKSSAKETSSSILVVPTHVPEDDTEGDEGESQEDAGDDMFKLDKDGQFVIEGEELSKKKSFSSKDGSSRVSAGLKKKVAKGTATKTKKVMVGRKQDKSKLKK